MVPIRHAQQPPTSGNARRPLAPIFLSDVARRMRENKLPPPRVNQRSVYQAMRILVDSSDSKSDSNNIPHPAFISLGNEVNNDLEVAADAEDNEDETESESSTEEEVEAIVQDGWRTFRSDIHTQIEVVHVNGCQYLQCKSCPKKYSVVVIPKDHLSQQHNWTGLTGVQTKRKRENENITDVINRMGPAVAEQREAIRIKLLSENLDKHKLEYLFVRMLVLCDLSFSLVQNYEFQTFLE